MGRLFTQTRQILTCIIFCLTLALVSHFQSLRVANDFTTAVLYDGGVAATTKSANADIAATTGATSNIATKKGGLQPTAYKEGIENGVLSRKEPSFFHKLQAETDGADASARCERYGYTYNTTKGINHLNHRRIFYGALVSGEPWELLEIAAAEAYGIFSGMAFVEGNRTQNLTPRRFRQLEQGPILARLFGVPIDMVQVRSYVDETETMTIGDNDGLDREHRQRAQILKGWKDLGMQKDDIGFLADVDEIMTRDAFRAWQSCDGIEAFDYEQHKCHHSKVKVLATTRVFESSPECITADREWWHPDAIIGHCLEEIGDSSLHPHAPRHEQTVYRAKGFGGDDGTWDGEDNMTTGYYPLWSAGDYRRVEGGSQMRLINHNDQSGHSNHAVYTGFHFHNFVAQFNHTRFKYLTYGHAMAAAATRPMKELSVDLQELVSCVTNEPYPQDQPYMHINGGFAKAPPFLPIYFYDDDYRQRRHEHVRQMIASDEAFVAALQREADLPTKGTTSRSQ